MKRGRAWYAFDKGGGVMPELLTVVSSAFRLFPDSGDAEVAAAALNGATMLRNDTFSFQILFKSGRPAHWTPVSVAVRCAGLPMAAYRVDYVNVTEAANSYGQAGFARSAPGLYPSPLYPRKLCSPLAKTGTDLVYEVGEKTHLASNGSWNALWVTVNPDGAELAPGKKQIEITLTELEKSVKLDSARFELEVLDGKLCGPTLYYTNWFHVDCLCDYYRVKPYSRAFYRYFKTFLANMVRHRQNTILLPAITPALDTVVGGRRRNVQLVDVEVTREGYRFGFDRLREFIRVCREAGIRCFEHPPLFSQWGAKRAVTVYDTAGKELFGWDTDAVDPEYTRFLHEYLRALLELERESECEFIFHISDEPPGDGLEDYRRAAESVRGVLAGHTVIDALSHVEFYKQGIVSTPVAFIAYAEDFYGQCDDFWLYYTGGLNRKEITSRLTSVHSARTRVLGLQLWYYGAKGFLHWGYNYCYDYMSTGIFDPISNPCGYKNYPGVCFLAYYTPEGAIPSIAEKLMGEAMDDVRALQTLEALVGRQTVLDLCRSVLGKPISNVLVPEERDMVNLRFALNEAIRREGKR